MCASKMFQKIREKIYSKPYVPLYLGIEVKFKCLIWIIQTSMPMVVLEKK